MCASYLFDGVGLDDVFIFYNFLYHFKLQIAPYGIYSLQTLSLGVELCISNVYILCVLFIFNYEINSNSIIYKAL